MMTQTYEANRQAYQGGARGGVQEGDVYGNATQLDSRVTSSPSVSATSMDMTGLTPQQKIALEMRRRQILAAQAARRAKMEKERERALRRSSEHTFDEPSTPTIPVSVVITSRPQADTSANTNNMSLRAIQGSVLRELRTRDHRTLREVSQKAGVSLGYLSEVERGQKEASSELLVSITKALGVPLSQVLMMIAKRVEEVEKQDTSQTGQTTMAEA